ncbi:helix-turn-helix transcriptional regulator [Halochromatium roseum]|uniref:helix-turn-helix transcriptional regulator n=1 Tax=Halochromatium roseum TaxID=391920 RepID=UPI0019118224|nr:WYL domain-containing protein [Halochromatium roseum]MBK5939835.1 WYL domain-containing protein [Halochromatium roseum]
MSATSHDRIQRLRRLEALLPRAVTAPADCPDSARLLEVLSAAYGEASEAARRRALQRDLAELLRQGRIETVNAGGRPLRYRRMGDEVEDDPLLWQYTLQQVRDLIREAVPSRRLDRLWQRLLNEFEGPLIDERRLRIVPDTLRLQPVELYPEVLQAVVLAVAQPCALKLLYAKSTGARSEVLIHPQALLQRGPIAYLFALKEDEPAPVRLYALHRMIRAEALTTQPARTAEGFDLDQAIAEGKVDFGQGRLIDLELRVRGYLVSLLSVCPLSADQQLEDEPETSTFTLRVSAQVPSTGQLLRWLLGAGDNLEVIAPAELRHVMTAQSDKVAALYRSPEQADVADYR